MAITTGIVLEDPDAWIKNIDPIVMVCSDRKGGWMIRHKHHQKWIKAIPTRVLADEILAAFRSIEDAAFTPPTIKKAK